MLKLSFTLVITILLLEQKSHAADSNVTTGLYDTCVDAPNKGSCSNNLNCTDYSSLDKQIGSRCECLEPAQDCRCETAAGVYRRWTRLNGKSKPEFSNKAPKAGWTKSGCYLENGEICKKSHDEDPKAATHLICKIDHYCKNLKDDFGFCKYGTASTSLVSLLLLSFTIFPLFLHFYS